MKEKKHPAATYSPADYAVPSAREGLTSVFGMGTGMAPPLWPPGQVFRSWARPWGRRLARKTIGTGPTQQYGQASRLISTGRLNMLPCLDLQPIDQVISLVPSVPSGGMGCLILRRVSHLDAFSGYPFRTWLPSDCRWHDNWHTRGSSTSVLSYWKQNPSNIQRLWQIGTELSHDVLNPARVPL